MHVGNNLEELRMKKVLFIQIHNASFSLKVFLILYIASRILNTKNKTPKSCFADYIV